MIKHCKNKKLLVFVALIVRIGPGDKVNIYVNQRLVVFCVFGTECIYSQINEVYHFRFHPVRSRLRHRVVMVVLRSKKDIKTRR